MKRIIVSFIVLTSIAMPGLSQTSDADKLGMAIEYFQSRKYSEALNLFVEIEKTNKLNPRFKAYIGVCHYYEWNYDKAAEYLENAIPRLDMFSPQERSFYYYACGESLFNIGEYTKAIPYYTTMLSICHDNEKPDAYYRLGFIHMFCEEWTDALDNFQSALVYYQKFRPDEKTRVIQIKNMINGCAEKIDEKADK